MCKTALIQVALAFVGFAGVSGHALAEGLQSSLLDWDRVQNRVALVTTSPSFTDLGFSDNSPKVSSLRLMSDYYVTRPFGDSAVSGLRATSGVWLGSRSVYAPGLSPGGISITNQQGLTSSLTDSGPENKTTPYLGVGYTGLSKGGWGISADLGLMALNPGSAVRLGGVFNGSQQLDDAVRDMRWAPLLQLGVSYSF